jgi:hypothetical protein
VTWITPFDCITFACVTWEITRHSFMWRSRWANKVLYFFFGGVGDTPLAEGFDAFCFGGPSFLGFRVSLPFGIFQFLRCCTCSQPNGGATPRVRRFAEGGTEERARQIGPA